MLENGMLTMAEGGLKVGLKRAWSGMNAKFMVVHEFVDGGLVGHFLIRGRDG